MQRARPYQTYLFDIRTDKHEQTKPMSNNNIYDEEYFHFEILNNKTEETDLPLEKSIDKILNLNKYKCHLCNIEVPKTYATEHNNSAKHKTCNKIANIALERTRHQIQLDIAVRRKIEVLDTYFCEPCAVVVLNSDKETHQMSKIHKISVKHDELLTDLLKNYEDIENIEENFEIDEFKLLKQRIEQESLQEPGLLDMPDEKTGDISINNAEVNFEINKLELLKQMIEQKSLQDSGLLEIYMDIPKENTDVENVIDTKEIKEEVFDAFISQFNSAFRKIADLETSHESENSHKSDKETHDATKISLKHNDDSIYMLKNWKEIENAELDSEVHELNKQNQNYEKNKNGVSTEVEREISFPDDIDNNSSSLEKAINIGKTNTYNKLANKIEAIMSKYFDSSCTIDALNNNTEKEHNKNKVNKQYLGQRNKKIAKKKSQIHFKAKDKNNQEQNQREAEEPNYETEQHVTLNTKTNENNIIIEEKTQKKDNPEQNKEELEHNKINPEHNKNNKDKNYKHKKQENPKVQPTTSKQIKPKAPSFSLVYYLKDISRRCETRPIHTVEATTDNIVQITAINRDKFKVLVNNFHSFHVKSNEICCKVCESPNVRRPEWHIVESEHRAKVMTPIKDLNGIRQLDDIWSHCILCNDLTRNVDFHLQSLHHKNKIKQTLIELGHDSQSDEENQKVEARQKPSTTNAAITELMTANNLAMTNKGYLNCAICDVIVDYDIRSVSQHINSFYHLDKFELKIAENKVVNTEGERFYCIVCDIQIAKMNVVTHCNGKKHGKLFQEFLTKQGQEQTEAQDEIMVLTSISQNVKKSSKDKVENSELICFVCNIIIHSIDEHTDTFDHKKSYLSYLESNKLNEIEPDTFYCIICNTVIGIDYLMSHCMSKKHKRVLKCFLCRKNGHNTDSNFCNNEGHQDNTNSNECNKQVHQDNTDCNICHKNSHQDNIECNDRNKKEHQDNNYNICHNQGQQDNIEYNICHKQGQQDNTECNICNKRGQQGNTQFNVCNKQGHQDKTECNFGNKQVQQDNDTKSQQSKSIGYNIAMPLKVLYQFQELKSSNNLLCTVCDEEVTYTRKLAAYHVSTLDHVVAFNLTMLWNKIKKRADKYFCDICRSDITYFSEISHVLGKEHADNLARQPKGTVYEYERTLVTHAYAMSHKVGDRVRPSPVVSVQSLEIV